MKVRNVLGSSFCPRLTSKMIPVASGDRAAGGSCAEPVADEERIGPTTVDSFAEAWGEEVGVFASFAEPDRW